MSSKKTRICFVNADTYPVLSGSAGTEYIGGESVQHTLLAKAFAEAGYDVSVVVRDFGQPQGETVRGINVWKTFRQEAGIPILRFFHPRMTSVLRALKLADADIYYQSCAGSVTGIVASFCKKHRRDFVFRVAHDTDLIPGEELIPYWRDKKIYQYGLRAADLIAVQSEHQSRLLEKHYGRKGTLVNMVVEPDNQPDTGKEFDVLWVNNLREFKRPRLLLELARSLPELQFAMVGGPCKGEEQLFESVSEDASKLANIEMLGPVPYSRVNQFFSRSRLFVNTSASEGFPNSFLQAWMRGLPVVSFFDPDTVIEKFSIGATVLTIDEMSGQIRKILANADLLEQMGARARQFVEARFSSHAVLEEYKAAFVEHSF